MNSLNWCSKVDASAVRIERIAIGDRGAGARWRICDADPPERDVADAIDCRVRRDRSNCDADASNHLRVLNNDVLGTG